MYKIYYTEEIIVKANIRNENACLEKRRFTAWVTTRTAVGAPVPGRSGEPFRLRTTNSASSFFLSLPPPLRLLTPAPFLHLSSFSSRLYYNPLTPPPSLHSLFSSRVNRAILYTKMDMNHLIGSVA